jgi:hypothetical protein
MGAKQTQAKGTAMTLNDHEEIPRADFDALARAKQFTVGPYQETQSTDYGAPYIAPLWLFGELRDGRKVKAKQ